MSLATLQDVRDRVEIEGFEYAFRSYSDFPEVEDPEFHRLREAFVKAADELETYLNTRTRGEMEEDDASND